eukprot:1194883-Prorocentrum_minimum.AAC.1
MYSRRVLRTLCKLYKLRSKSKLPPSDPAVRGAVHRLGAHLPGVQHERRQRSPGEAAAISGEGPRAQSEAPGGDLLPCQRRARLRLPQAQLDRGWRVIRHGSVCRKLNWTGERYSIATYTRGWRVIRHGSVCRKLNWTGERYSIATYTRGWRVIRHGSRHVASVLRQRQSFNRNIYLTVLTH